MPGYRLDLLKTVRQTAQSATGAIGSGTNGVVTTTVTLAGAAGNLYTIRVIAGSGNNSALAAAIVGAAITVTLATDGSALPNDAANTATLIAAAVSGVSGVSAVASGNGNTAISGAISAVSFSGGRDKYLVADIARESNTSCLLIHRLESGGNCERHEADQIAAALGSTLTLLGAAAL